MSIFRGSLTNIGNRITDISIVKLILLLNLQKAVIPQTRELKIETFSGRRRPDWQSKPGTEVAVASLQNSNIKIAVNSGGRRLGRLPKRKIWLRIKN